MDGGGRTCGTLRTSLDGKRDFFKTDEARQGMGTKKSVFGQTSLMNDPLR